MKNNNYDGREKLEILKAEHYSLNSYLWGTIILIFIQIIILNDPSNYVYGQLSLTVFVYLFTMFYLGIKEIWRRNIKLSNPKADLHPKNWIIIMQLAGRFVAGI